MDKDKILMVALVFMVLIASVQTIQLFGIKQDIKESGFSLSTSTTVSKTSPGIISTAINIEAEIPDQVGGCF